MRLRAIHGKSIGTLALMLVLAGLVSSALAQDEKSTEHKPGTEAMYLLKYMAGFLAELKQLKVEIACGYDVVQPSGRKIEFHETRQVTLVRPTKLRIDVERDDGGKSFVLFDGETLSAYDFQRKVLAATPRPGDVDGAVKYFVKDLKMRLPLAMLFTAGLPAEVESRVKSAEVVQRVTLFDVPCLHVAARAEKVDFQAWIPEKGAPLPRRIVITYRNEPGQPQFRADLSGWNLAPNPPDSTFSFSPPDGIERVPFLAEIVGVSPVPPKKGGRK